MTEADFKALIRTIPDFPKPGILFRDVTTLIGDGSGFAAAVAAMADLARAAGAEAIAGIEARGFIFGAAMAATMGLPFIPVRKPGKLPVAVLAIDYALEYGTDTLEVDPGAVGEGRRVVLVDDLLATGGTAMAAAELLRRAGGVVEEALFAVELPELGGRTRLAGANIVCRTLMTFEGH
ncbi:adenine phosphoribosyltransferase [Novosphingobium sp. 9]|uniref:adenine phosphoribosyltransferase n=1 Tax=Novosphingobium sp. 9 TaxID=2025349 RepID=UPI0021B5F8C2|nr:adenine phosphoribosyltransferase [Novosphingobium sp. 9]